MARDDHDPFEGLSPEERRRRERERRKRERRRDDDESPVDDALDGIDAASTGGCSLPASSWIGRGSSRGGSTNRGGGSGQSSEGCGSWFGGGGGGGRSGGSGSGCGGSGGGRGGGGGGCDGCDCNFTLLNLLSVSTLLVVAARLLPGSGTRPVVRALIRGYQRRLTRFTPTCPQTPSCSAYALTAVDELGTRRGLRAAARRVASCGTRRG